MIWALYAFFAGRLGGKAFEDNPLLGLLVAFGGALALSGIIEVVRRVIAWRKRARQAQGERAGEAERERAGEAGEEER